MDLQQMKEEIELLKIKIKEDKRKDKVIDQVLNDIYKKELRKKLMKELNLNNNKKGYYFITINPKECEILDLNKMINQIIKKKWLKMIAYTYEQRGETEEERGKGKHIHILIENNHMKSRVINEIHNSVKHYCEKEKVNVKVITNQEKEKYINYMKGNKSNEKKEKVEQDKKWKEDNNISLIYV